MAKGNIAKEKVNQIISEAFGKDYIGVIDKKIYVQAEENGEKVQIAISLTCPKTQVPTTNVDESDDFSFSAEKILSGESTVEFTQEEKDTIDRLIEALGL